MTGDSILREEDQREGDDVYFTPPAPKKGRLHEMILKDPIEQLNAPEPIVLEPKDSVLSAIEKMRSKRFGSVLVSDGGKLCGIFTEADLITHFSSGDLEPANVEIGQVMTRDPHSIRQEESLAAALNSMSTGGYRHIPVVEDNGRPVGFISIRGILRYIAENALSS